MDFDAATPEIIANVIAAEIGREAHYREIELGCTERAAEQIASCCEGERLRSPKRARLGRNMKSKLANLGCCPSL